jgi:hypothetical protein
MLELWSDEKMRILRHQVVAHRPSSSTVEQVFAVVQPTLNKLDELIELLTLLID